MVVVFEKVLGCVGEGHVSEVVAERAHTYDTAPVLHLLLGFEELRHLRMAPRLREDIEDPAGELHDAEAMFESAMRRTGIDEIRERQLVDVPVLLKGV